MGYLVNRMHKWFKPFHIGGEELAVKPHKFAYQKKCINSSSALPL
jgi:hypothetical protein